MAVSSHLTRMLLPGWRSVNRQTTISLAVVDLDMTADPGHIWPNLPQFWPASLYR